jgi:serine/threonine protein kinase
MATIQLTGKVVAVKKIV